MYSPAVAGVMAMLRQRPRRPTSAVRRTRLPGGLWVPSESATIRAWNVVGLWQQAQIEPVHEMRSGHHELWRDFVLSEAYLLKEYHWPNRNPCSRQEADRTCLCRHKVQFHCKKPPRCH